LLQNKNVDDDPRRAQTWLILANCCSAVIPFALGLLPGCNTRRLLILPYGFVWLAHPPRQAFIVEGTDGSGKSTQLAFFL
jgi:hypothetical protein